MYAIHKLCEQLHDKIGSDEYKEFKYEVKDSNLVIIHNELVVLFIDNDSNEFIFIVCDSTIETVRFLIKDLQIPDWTYMVFYDAPFVGQRRIPWNDIKPFILAGQNCKSVRCIIDISNYKEGKPLLCDIPTDYVHIYNTTIEKIDYSLINEYTRCVAINDIDNIDVVHDILKNNPQIELVTNGKIAYYKYSIDENFNLDKYAISLMLS